MLPDSADPALIEAISAARSKPAFLEALQQVLDDAEAALAGRQDGCEACGTCCHFDQWGHRLYASTGEIALLLQSGPPTPAAPLRCGYQRGALCGARRGRPLGCRVYFCRDESVGGAVYEAAHERIRQLHSAHGIAYFYTEATAAVGFASRD